MIDLWQAWIPLLLLGAVHGINPAMGWLFAVSLGLQEQRGSAVWRALGPLALGHALAIGVTLIVAAGLGRMVPLDTLKWIAAGALLGAGVFHLLGHGHPRWSGMRVGARDLTIWSFLVASAHGAGLMAVPFALDLIGPSGHVGHGPAGAAALHGGHHALVALPGLDPGALLAMLVHTAGYLAVAGLVAVLVYEKLGLRLLRTAWLNLNVIWAAALILTGVLTPLL